MSTRAVIAQAHGDTWEGRYHHFDGYPRGLGKQLYEVYGQIGLERMKKLLLEEHPAGWSTILECDINATPGYRELVRHDGEPTRWTPEHDAWELTQGPRCYCHGDRHDTENWLITPDDETWCEWAYVLGEKEPVMTVFKNRGGVGAAQWKPVAVVRLDGQEPLWEGIEGMADE